MPARMHACTCYANYLSIFTTSPMLAWNCKNIQLTRFQV